VAIIPETDENAIKLSEEIHGLKGKLDEANKAFTVVRNDLSLVTKKRKDKFMGFFS